MPSLKFDVIVDGSQGRVALKQFANETDAAFKRSHRAVSRISLQALPDHERAVVRVKRKYDNLNKELKKLEQSGRVSEKMAAQWRKSLGTNMQADLDRLEAKGKATFANISESARASIATMVTAMAGFATVQGVKDIANITMEFQGMETALKTVTGSQGAMREEMAYLRTGAKRLGLDLIPLIQDYTKLAAAAKGSVLEGEQTRHIFSSVASAARVLNLSVSDTSGVLRAINQMMSKGKVQAEELRGQLGERLPGAFQLAAKAMGKTDAELNKMLEDGQVLATDLLPKLAVELENVYGPGVAEAASNAAASFARLKTSMVELANAIGQSGLVDSLAKIADLTTDAVNFWFIDGKKAEEIDRIKGEILGVNVQLEDLYERHQGATEGFFRNESAAKNYADQIEVLERRLKGLNSQLTTLTEQQSPSGVPVLEPSGTKKKYTPTPPEYNYINYGTMGPDAPTNPYEEIFRQEQELLTYSEEALQQSYLNRTEILQNWLTSELELAGENEEKRQEAITAWKEQELELAADFENRKLKIYADAESKRAKSSKTTSKFVLDLEKAVQSKSLKGWSTFFEQQTAMTASSSRTMFEINKAAAVASATIDAWEAITGAYKVGARIGGPPLGAAFAAGAAAFQWPKIDAIMSTTFGGGGGSGSGLTVGSVPVAPSQIDGYYDDQTPVAEQGASASQVINVYIDGDVVDSDAYVRDKLADSIQKAITDGVM